MLLPFGACDDGRNLAGQYILVAVDGVDASEYLMENSAGQFVTAAGGGVDLCGDGRYRMNISYRDEDGRQVPVVSSGHFERNDATLTLVDSGDLGPVAASVTGGLLTVQMDAHEFELLMLVQLPPFTPPDCG